MLFKCENCGKRYWKPSSRRACWTADTRAYLAEGRDRAAHLIAQKEHTGKPISHVRMTETGTTDAMASLLSPPPEVYARQSFREENLPPPRPLPDRSLGESESRWWVGGRSHASDVDSTDCRSNDRSDSRDSDSCSSSGDSSGGGD